MLDVGGGASRLCEALVAAGHRDIGVLDLSRVALDAAQARVGDVGGVSWIEADVLSWEPARTWDVWHDRAVLHFLMTDAERDAYRNRLMSALAPEVARRLAALRASPEVQRRIDELADKSSEGTLSADERAEYETWVRAINFLGVLQAKARRSVAEDGPA